MEFERYTVRSTWIVSQLISKMPSRREHKVDISDSLVVAFILGVRETHASHSHTRITASKKKLGAHNLTLWCVNKRRKSKCREMDIRHKTDFTEAAIHRTSFHLPLPPSSTHTIK